MAAATLSLAEENGISVKMTPGLIVGGLTVFLGILVIVGWHTGNTTLIQVLLSFPPMAYNAALGFMLCGLALIALDRQHRPMLLAFGVATLALGGLTLSQSIFDIDLRIDQLLMTPYVFSVAPNPGRMPAATATCFAIGGAALVFAGSVKDVKKCLPLLGIAGTLLAAQGILVVAGYVIRLERLSDLPNLSILAVHSGVGFLALGAGMTAFAWLQVMRTGQRIPRWAHICVGIAIATATIYLWEALRARTDNIATITNASLDHLADNVILVFGLGLSVALSLALMFAQQSRSRLRLAEQEVTERKRAEQTAVRHLAELERINAELEQFAYVASHDLKAPLRGIDNLASWIQEDMGDALQGDPRDHLALLRKRVSRMEALLDDLLTYSRAGHGDVELSLIDSGALVKEIADLSNLPTGFTVTTLPGMPIFETAKAPLEQVLRNLIGNAAKHRDRDDGQVTVSAHRDGAMYEFTVADNGPGIAPEFQDRIFKMFQTLKPRDDVEGSGMGLAIVRKLVDAHGGSIRVQSEEGQRGTSFHFTWPKEITELDGENAQ